MQRYGAEFIGTFWLVLGGCGSAVLAAGIPRGRHRAPRRVARLRAHGPHDGLRDRPHLRLPSEPGRLDRALRGRPLPGDPARSLHRRPGAGCDRGGRRALS